MAKLKSPADSSGASVGGNWYQSKGGFIDVPDDCVVVLVPFGFEQVSIDAPTDVVIGIDPDQVIAGSMVTDPVETTDVVEEKPSKTSKAK